MGAGNVDVEVGFWVYGVGLAVRVRWGEDDSVGQGAEDEGGFVVFGESVEGWGEVRVWSAGGGHHGPEEGFGVYGGDWGEGGGGIRVGDVGASMRGRWGRGPSVGLGWNNDFFG